MSEITVLSKFTHHAYIQKHLYALNRSFGYLKSAPWSGIFTVWVLAIALLFPTAFWMASNSINRHISHLDVGGRVLLFLKMDVNATVATRWVEQWRDAANVESVRYIAPDEGLRQFSSDTGLSDLLKTFSSNPLPGVIEIRPKTLPENTDTWRVWLQQFTSANITDNVQVDYGWLTRWFSLIKAFTHLVELTALLLVFAAGLVTANSIRLALQDMANEIHLLHILGAPKHFIERPFLYTGFIYGFFAGILALLLLEGLSFSVVQIFSHIAALYNMSLVWHGLSATMAILLVATASFLGWLVAFVTARFQISAELIL